MKQCVELYKNVNTAIKEAVIKEFLEKPFSNDIHIGETKLLEGSENHLLAEITLYKIVDIAGSIIDYFDATNNVALEEMTMKYSVEIMGDMISTPKKLS